MRLLPHAHDYQMDFPDELPGGNARFTWRFVCTCGKVIIERQKALDDMWWSRMNRRVACVLWFIAIAFVGLVVVAWSTAK